MERHEQSSCHRRLPSPKQGLPLSLSTFTSLRRSSYRACSTLRLQVRSISGRVLRTLKVYSNLDAREGFQPQAFDLSPFAGQTVRIHFEAREDRGSYTSFVLDDLNLIIR